MKEDGELVNADGTPGIKLIYIDPPFATKQDFLKNGEKVYQDKIIGSEFLEFLRHRLVLAKELLSRDGVIWVHLDGKKGHYVKTLMDEIFGENNFLNEIIWRYFMGGKSKNFFSRKHDNIFVYKKSEDTKLSIETRERILDYKPTFIDEDSLIKEFKGKETKSGEERVFYTSEVKEDDVWEISGVFNMSQEYTDYPTQKPEALLQRVIRSSTKEGDIVFDFFAGSGTSLAVAEKMNRRWIGCDCAKLSMYTIQKRILNISKSKSLDDGSKKYDKEPIAFTLYNAGLYDFETLRQLPWESWRFFALKLFECKDEPHKISGFQIERSCFQSLQ